MEEFTTSEEDQSWCVYMHTNKINNKVYVGITKQKPERRWQNGYGYKNNQYFSKAINKYGWDNFEHIIFADNLTSNEAEHIEVLLIALYNTTNIDYGYNLSSGGSSGHVGVKHSDESKKKMVETRIKLYSDGGHPRCGTVHTRETKEKMSKAKMKPIVQLTKDLKFVSEFESQTIASQSTGVNYSDISACCNKKRKSAGGFVWLFKSDYNNKFIDLKGEVNINECI